jgi:hypothetical protein
MQLISIGKGYWKLFESISSRRSETPQHYMCTLLLLQAVQKHCSLLVFLVCEWSNPFLSQRMMDDRSDTLDSCYACFWWLVWGIQAPKPVLQDATCFWAPPSCVWALPPDTYWTSQRAMNEKKKQTKSFVLLAITTICRYNVGDWET